MSSEKSNNENNFQGAFTVNSPEWPYQVEKAFQETVEKAIQDHLKSGNPVVVGRDGMRIQINPDGSEKILGPM